MSKIVSIVTEKPHTASLLKSIINEWPWDKKKEAAPSEEPEDDKDETPDIELKTLDTFSSKLIQPAPNTERFVIRLPASSIKQLYFDKKGPESLVATLNDEILAKFISNPLKVASKKSPAEIQQMPKGFKFSDQLKGNGSANYAVLLDVPAEILKKLSAAKSAGEAGVNEARTVLIEALAHKFYVMVLSISASSKIAEKIDAAGTDLDAISNVLVPNMLVAMPKAGEVKVVRDAIIEHNESNGEASSEETKDGEDSEAENKSAEPEKVEVPKTIQQQFKSLLSNLEDADPATFNHITQLLADIGHAADKKKKMAEISRLISPDEGA